MLMERKKEVEKRRHTDGGANTQRIDRFKDGGRDKGENGAWGENRGKIEIEGRQGITDGRQKEKEGETDGGGKRGRKKK